MKNTVNKTNIINQSVDKKDIRKRFVKYVVPSIMGMMISAAYVILDGIFVGRGIGDLALGAINVVFPLTMIVIALAMLIAIGGANLFSFYKGQGKPHKSNNVFAQSITLILIIGMILSLTFYIFREPICYLLGANDEIIDLATAYLKWLAPFFTIQMLALAMGTFIRNDNSPKLAMVGTMTGAVINAILDFYLIIILGMGIEVAAFTNGVGLTIEVIIYSLHFRKKERILHFQKPKFNLPELKKIAQNGFASFLMELSQSTLIVSFNLVLARQLGALGLSAYSIASYVFSIATMFLIGVTQGAQPIMSYYHGKNNREVVLYSQSLGLKTAFVFSSIFVIVSVVFSDSLIFLFHSGKPELIDLTATILRYSSWAYIFVGFTLMNILYFQTTAQNKYSSIVSFLRCFGFVQLSLIVLPYFLGVKGIFLAFLVGEALNFLVSHIFFRKSFKHFSLARAKELAQAKLKKNSAKKPQTAYSLGYEKNIK